MTSKASPTQKKMDTIVLSGSENTEDEGDPTVAVLLKDKDNSGSQTLQCNHKADPFFRYKLTKQIVLVLLWINMGYGRGISGPVLPDLKAQFECDYEEIARVAAMSSIGFVLGAFTGGMLHERYHRHTDLFMACAILLGGVGQAAIPWMPNFLSLVPLFIIVGFSGAVQNAGGNTMVLDLWGKKAASAMFTLHLGFGIGSFFGPIVCKPFLSEKIGEVPVYIVNGTTIIIDNSTAWDHIDPNLTTTQDIRSEAYLAFPFALEGIFDIFLALGFMMYYMRGPPKGFPVKKGTSKMKDLFRPGKCTEGNSMYGCLLLILLFLFYIQAIGGELVFGQFLYAFATESQVQFSMAEATNLTAVFYLCHLSGRALGAVLSRCLSINLILIIDIIGLIGSTIFLALFGFSVPAALWIGTGAIGLLCSFVYPAGMIWANLHMHVNSMVVMVTMFGGSMGFVVYTYLGGYLIEYVSMRAFLYLECVYALILAVVFCLMFLLGRKYGKKDQKETGNDDDDVQEEGSIADEDIEVVFTADGNQPMQNIS